MQDLETTIRRHLVSYLAGDASLDAFTDWFVGATWNIDDAECVEALQLAHSIELALAEASSGLLSIEELNAEFHGLVEYATINS